jgi:hypothetical protein
MNKFQQLLTRKPPELMKAANILVQSHAVSTETALEIIRTDFMPCLDAVYTVLEDLRRELSSTGKVSENKLATYFMVNPTVLQGFEVHEDQTTMSHVISYNGEIDKISITKGYNNLIREVIKVFGFKDLSFQTISNAIIRAYCWYQEKSEPDQILQLTSESCILDVVSNLTKQFTISDVKKALPDLTMTTKQIESTLLLNGYIFKQYGTARKKHFTREV